MWGYVLIPAGVTVLTLAWLGRTRSWPLVTVGWGLVAGGITGLAITGADRAAAFGLLTFVGSGLVAVAALAIGHNSRQSQNRDNPRRRERTMAAPPFRLARINAAGLATFGVAVPLAGIASFLVTAALGRAGSAVGLHPANGVVLAFAFTPLVWAGLSTIVLMRPDQRATQAITLAGLSAIAATPIFF